MNLYHLHYLEIDGSGFGSADVIAANQQDAIGEIVPRIPFRFFIDEVKDKGPVKHGLVRMTTYHPGTITRPEGARPAHAVADTHERHLKAVPGPDELTNDSGGWIEPA